MNAKREISLLIIAFVFCILIGIYTLSALTEKNIQSTEGEEGESIENVLTDVSAKYDLQGTNLDGPSAYVSINVNKKDDVSSVKKYLGNHLSRADKDKYDIDVFT